jgi:hypothetical protein
MKPGHAMSLGDVADLTFASRPIGCKTQLRRQVLLPGIEPHFSNRLKSFAHDSGRTLVRAEYGYPNGISKHQQLKKKSAATAQYTAPLSAHPNGPVVNLMEQPDNNRRLRRHLPNDLPARFLV